MFLILANLDEFEFRQDPTSDCGVSSPLASEKVPIDLQWGNSCDQFSAFNFAWIVFVFGSNKDMHKSLDELKFQPDATTDY